jgi:hypothetical protein
LFEVGHLDPIMQEITTPEYLGSLAMIRLVPENKLIPDIGYRTDLYYIVLNY